jgi:hypothetical protein
MRGKTPKTPAGLCPLAAALWKQTLLDFDLEQHHVVLLEQACRALTAAEAARAAVERDGAFPLDRFKQPKAHPGLLEERNSRALFARLMRELGLDVQGATEPGRLPRLPGARL